MSSTDLSLVGVKSLDDVLAKTKNGQDVLILAENLGLWSSSLHKRPAARASFPVSLSTLELTQLSDLYASWTSEYGRIIELCGALNGQQDLIKLKLKSVQAAARARTRRLNPDIKYTATALADSTEDDPGVIDLFEQQSILVVALSAANAAKEATNQYLTTLSREISFRDAQLKARVLS